MKRAYLLLLTLSLVTALSACISSSASADSSKEEAVVAETTAAETAASSVYDEAAMVDSAAGGMGIAENTMPGAEVPEESVSESLTATEDTSRKLIKDVNMSVETREFDKLTAAIEAKAAAVSGYVESSSVSGNVQNGETRWGYYTVRIPTDRLDEFMDSAFEYANIISKSERLTDITLKYTDTESRITALRTEQERLTELLAEADSVDTLIVLEDRLSEIRYELQNYESQLRLYDNQVSYSTVRIDVTEVQVFTKQKEAGVFERIGAGIAKNMHGLGVFLENAVIFIVSFLPVAVVLGAVVFAGYKAVKAVRRLKEKRRNEKRKKNEKTDS